MIYVKQQGQLRRAQGATCYDVLNWPCFFITSAENHPSCVDSRCNLFFYPHYFLFKNSDEKGGAGVLRARRLLYVSQSPGTEVCLSFWGVFPRFAFNLFSEKRQKQHRVVRKNRTNLLKTIFSIKCFLLPETTKYAWILAQRSKDFQKFVV